MKKIIQVPFDMQGNQITWDGYRCTLVDNYEFSAKLVYSGFERGRSALNIVWTDIEKLITYRSGMYLLDGIITGGNDEVRSFFNEEGILQIEGNFTFKKQGTSVLLISTK